MVEISRFRDVFQIVIQTQTIIKETLDIDMHLKILKKLLTSLKFLKLPRGWILF